MRNSLIIGAVLAALVGCDSEPQATIELFLRAPDRNIQSITASQLALEVLIDDEPYVLQSTGQVWRRSLSLPTDRELPLEIRWSFGPLPVAAYETTIGPISESDSADLTVTPEDYVSTGTAFDADADGISNLQELVGCTDPESSSNVSVRIPRVAEVLPIGINGRTGVTWDGLNVTDLCGELPFIDNLMIDQGATYPDGQSGFYWQAAYNSELLYILVYAEDASVATPFGDSTNLTRDDSINIFIDGDNSKLTSYDGVNDFHITIPFLKLAAPATESRDLLVFDDNGDLAFSAQGDIGIRNDAGEAIFVPAGAIETNRWVVLETGIIDEDRRIAYGSMRDRLENNVSFYNGIPNSGRQVYEVSIRLDAVDITIGQPFGFDIQIDDDADGGARNARYGWKHPSRLPEGPDVDSTVSNPGFMGTVVLE